MGGGRGCRNESQWSKVIGVKLSFLEARWGQGEVPTEDNLEFMEAI